MGTDGKAGGLNEEDGGVSASSGGNDSGLWGLWGWKGW